MDPRIQKLAKLMVNYSLKLKKGQLFKIKGEVVTLPLLTAVYEEALKVGAHPFIDLVAPEVEELLLRQATKEQLEYLTPMTNLEIKKIDAFFYAWGHQNVFYLAGVDPKKQAIVRKARKPWMMKYFQRTADGTLSWVGTQFPTQADAQQAEMSLSDYEDFVYGAGYLHLPDPVKHWKQVEKEQTRLVKILNRVDRLHVRGSNVDLTMRVKGRKWISCHGTENFPDGEIFTSPHEDTMQGFVNFSFPAVYDGRVVENVKFEFKKGKVVAESADKNLAYLKAMLDVDAGGRRVGEFAIGTNYQIKRSTGNTLFDEKIGGTFHMAVGASIPEAGGTNKSGIHWDMVCDLKKDGEIEADGKVIYRKGKFLI